MSTQDHQLQPAEENKGEEAGGLVALLQGLIEAARAMVAHSRALSRSWSSPANRHCSEATLRRR